MDSFITAFRARHDLAMDEMRRLSPSGTTLLGAVDSMLVRYACCALVLLGGVYVATTRLPLLTYATAIYASVVGLAFAHALGMPAQYEVVLAPLLAALAASHPAHARLGLALLFGATLWTQLYASTTVTLIKDAVAGVLDHLIIPWLFRSELLAHLYAAAPFMLALVSAACIVLYW